MKRLLAVLALAGSCAASAQFISEKPPVPLSGLPRSEVRVETAGGRHVFQVWIADMRLFEDHNSVWNEWVDPANPPARACLTTEFWRPGMLVEVMVVAAVP